MSTILCIGDSNTWGYDPRSYFGSRYPDGIPWTDRLTGEKIINCGMNGLSIPYDARPFTDLIRSKAPDLVTVMLGTNDLLQGRGAEETAEAMAAFLAALRETGIPVILIAPPPLQRGEWVQSVLQIEESRKLADLYRSFAGREGIPFADAGEWKVEVTFDGVHFSAAGHAAFAQGLSAFLRQMKLDEETAFSP